ncbi:Tetratricopeptide-like helical [Penicillium griseofulvum]|uniref:Tetratricopeptide-like helical n=1 Tax=Penicillium patulum TaxID=5078 RepID=A0A135LIR2_PENPA|nr:Tetratricopeptide-like helical [Penicillium griseofulvum]KXG48871.1 Tetratricopeptide-like helical [Penicillium griseofulvum]
MDAPGATSPDESAVQSTPKHDTSIQTSSPTDTTQGAQDIHQRCNDSSSSSSNDEEEEEEEAEEEDDLDDEDEEPRLKYAYLTKHLGSVYRNGDATSSFLVAGDKMVVGTHNGNVHIMSLPLLQSLRVYHAHTASVTSISVSPFPPPLPNLRQDTFKQTAEEYRPSTRSSNTAGSIRGGKLGSYPTVPSTPSNSIYIGTSSIDGHVCVSSLVDPKDVLLRNFGRPVQSIALSPEYKTDRSYLSGGRAGELVLTAGGRIGATSNSTTMGGAAATASSWLGSMGLASNSGKDTILHSGEGAISTIKWSLSGKYVAWVNEEGIKIMRSNLHLDSSETEFAWKRISHIDRPNRPGWEEMAGVWKARAEWIDQSALDSRDNLDPNEDSTSPEIQSTVLTEKVEKLVVGWGGTVWVIDVYPERASKTSKGEKLGSAEVVTILRTDCVVSGISLYTPRLLVILAYMETEGENTSNGRSSGIRNRKKGLEPELRVIDIETKEEISADTLSINRFEGLSASDYHLSVLPPWKTPEGQVVQRGALGALGYGLLDATMYSARLFSSGASIRSTTSSGDKGSGRVAPSFISKLHAAEDALPKEVQEVSGAPGAKIFVHSPYDCVVAVKRDLADRLSWLDSHGQYEDAWRLVDEHPEAAGSIPDVTEAIPEAAGRSQTSLGEFFDDRSSIMTAGRTKVSAAEQEKARLGELWINQLVSEEKWIDAARICGKVIRNAPRWEHWAWTFIKNDKIDEITSQIPIDLNPSLSSRIYEVILSHYVPRDLAKFKELIETWPSDLFDANIITEAIEAYSKSKSVRAGSEEWRILTDCLAKLFLVGGHYREALRCYIRLQDGDAAMALVREHRLLDAVTDDIPAFIMIRVSEEQMNSAMITELEELTSEPTRLLVSEAYTGIVPPETVVSQLIAADRFLFLYFYLRALWRGESLPHDASKPRRGRGIHARDAASKLAADEGKALIDNFADTAVEVFADYDRPLLMEFLQTSISYSFEKATSICEDHKFTPELIFLLSKMGQTKRALNLILSDLKDVSQAISFAKSQDDPDLWEDLLDYSMDKPKFIHGLLVEAGTAIDPIKLVRRIPSGLEIEGLREGLTRLIREHDLQASISQGAARVMQSEVALGMDTLRKGQRRGIKFDIISDAEEDRNKTPTPNTPQDQSVTTARKSSPGQGRCGGCNAAFRANEREILVAFACGHIFHLSHLHSDTSQQQSGASSRDRSADITPRPMSPVDETRSATASRTVGPKVTTARILRDKIGDGCRLCTLSRDIESLGEVEV